MRKYLFLVATLLLTLNMSVSAQNNRGNANNRRNADNRRSEQMMKTTPQERADLMAKELDLTTDQTAQVLELMKKQDAERQAQVEQHRKERETGRQNRDARVDEFRAARLKEFEKQQADLEKIIGKEKMEKWNESRKVIRDSNRAGRRNSDNRNK